MNELDAFVAGTVQRLTEADTALHNGDPGPPRALWSKNDPVTLFGAAVTKAGWDEIEPALGRIASRFSKCESVEYEVLSADSSGDLAYIVGLEHINASVGDAPPVPYSVRVTTLLRREDGEWKVIHRHGDVQQSSAAAPDLIARFNGGRPE